MHPHFAITTNTASNQLLCRDSNTASWIFKARYYMLCRHVQIPIAARNVLTLSRKGTLLSESTFRKYLRTH